MTQNKWAGAPSAFCSWYMALLGARGAWKAFFGLQQVNTVCIFTSKNGKKQGVEKPFAAKVVMGRKD